MAYSLTVGQSIVYRQWNQDNPELIFDFFEVYISLKRVRDNIDMSLFFKYV